MSDHEPGCEYLTYNNPDNLSIHTSLDEIVFIADQGDIMHFSINYETYYAVIGYMVSKRLIAIDFKEP